jgi:hypothetical protein
MISLRPFLSFLNFSHSDSVPLAPYALRYQNQQPVATLAQPKLKVPTSDIDDSDSETATKETNQIMKSKSKLKPPPKPDVSDRGQDTSGMDAPDSSGESETATKDTNPTLKSKPNTRKRASDNSGDVTKVTEGKKKTRKMSPADSSWTKERITKLPYNQKKKLVEQIVDWVQVLSIVSIEVCEQLAAVLQAEGEPGLDGYSISWTEEALTKYLNMQSMEKEGFLRGAAIYILDFYNSKYIHGNLIDWDGAD